jgi:tetratricopeptide (TPR) repeat protein
MARVVCPICKSGFEARISREDYAINCVSCGIAFNAAAFLPNEEFKAISERRAPAGTPSPYDRGTYVLGSVIRPAEPPAQPVFTEPVTPETRTGGLAFMYEQTPPPSPGVSAIPAPVAPPAPVPAPPTVAGSDAFLPVAPGALQPPRKAARSFLEASGTTTRFRALKPTGTLPPVTSSALETGPLGAGLPPDPKDGCARTGVRPRPPMPHQTGVNEALYKSWLLREPMPLEAPASNASAVQPAAPEAVPGQGPAAPVAAEVAPAGPTSSVPSAPPVASAPKPPAERSARPLGRRTPSTRRRPILEGIFGPYEIEGEIARGGVGAVFRAREVANGRPVALKVLLDGEDADEVDRERFRRECETSKSLGLPGMVQILAVGEVDGRPYMAMELVEGRSLDKLIPEKSLSVQDSLVLMQSVAETSGALHEAGYVHRDIKPANILLDAYGTPKLADFGLVKSLDEVTRLTAAGLVCGTPAYMAPEQARGEGKAVDPRSDVWALGAVLYEMLAATPPFQADNALRLMLRITKEDPRPPRHLNPKIPRDVEAMVLKCLQKNPEKRYPNGRALAEDIKRFLEGQPIEARRAPTVHRLWEVAHERRGVAVGIVAGLAAVVVAAVLVRTAFAPPDANALTEKGCEALRTQNSAEAETLFRAALRQDPRLARAQLGLGRALGETSIDPLARKITDPARFQEALAATRKARELDSDLAPEAHTQTGWLYMNAKMFDAEVHERLEAVRLKSDSPDYHFHLGLAYWNLGGPLGSEALTSGQRQCYDKALQAFDTVLNLRTEYPKAREYMKILKERFLARPSQAAALSR